MTRGDVLADIPGNTASLRVGLEHDSGWNSYATAKFIDAMCDSVGCNRIGDRFSRTESLFVVDLASHYNLTPKATSPTVDIFLSSFTTYTPLPLVPL